MALCRDRHSAGAARLRRARLCRRFAALFGLKRELLEQKRNPSGALVGAVPGHYQHSEHSHQSAVIGMPCSPPPPPPPPRRAAHRAQRHTSQAAAVATRAPSPPRALPSPHRRGDGADAERERVVAAVAAAERAQRARREASRARDDRASSSRAASAGLKPTDAKQPPPRPEPPRHRAPCRHLTVEATAPTPSASESSPP